MENKGLLKLPETWFVKVTNENRDVLSQWRFDSDSKLEVGCITGVYKWENGHIDKEWSLRNDDDTYRYGQEITFADFKRLVLGEKNAEYYGVRGCKELKDYFLDTKNNLSGGDFDFIYFYNNHKWIYRRIEKSNRQTLPLQEYLKLIEPEIMEKKYEYKLRDKKYLQAVNKLLDINEHYSGINISHDSKLFHLLNNDNVLDLFFEKIEVKELPIIGGSKPIISEDGDLIEIAGFQIDMYIIDHFKSFTLGNDIHVSESDIKQIREYLRK